MKKTIEQALEFCDKFCDEVAKQKQEMTEWAIEFSQEFIRKYDEVTPFHIVLIDLILKGKREIYHSRFLPKLLSYKDKDAKYPILESFFNDLLKFKKIKITKPKIEREKDRIDISVYDKKGDYFLIIENKVNNAPDRSNQLARYINTAKEKMKDIKKIYICYLPDNGKEPKENSWENPEENSKSYKDAFEGRFRIVSFRGEILEWLKETLKINDEQKFLQAAIEQYAYLIENRK
jgi:hypothetical protein